jgi:hypothetical protein
VIPKSGRFPCNPCWMPTTGFVDMTPMASQPAKTLKRLGIIPKWDMSSDPRLDHFKMVSPGGKPVKRLYLSIMLWFMGRAIQAAARVDREVRKAFDAIPDGFTFALNVAPDGPAMVVGKDQSRQVRYLGSQYPAALYRSEADPQEHRNGDPALHLSGIHGHGGGQRPANCGWGTPAACTVVRILDMVEVFLLPKRLASLAVRRYPQWPPLRKYMGRVLIYMRALAGV